MFKPKLVVLEACHRLAHSEGQKENPRRNKNGRKQEMTKIEWNRKMKVAVAVLLVGVPTGAITAFTLLNAGPGTPKSYPLLITLDKHVYHAGERINYTVKNVSNRTLRFSDWAYSMEYQRWTGFYWQFYRGVAAEQALRQLKPGETGHVSRLLPPEEWDSGYLSPGRWRIYNQRYDCWAEFEVD